MKIYDHNITKRGCYFIQSVKTMKQAWKGVGNDFDESGKWGMAENVI